MFKCKEQGCGKVVKRISDIRNCTRCRSVGRAQIIEKSNQNDEGDALLTSLLMASVINSFEPHSHVHESDNEAFQGGGGESSGGGASGSFETPDSDSDSSSGSDSSSSSDSNSSSSDSGSSSSGGSNE